MTLAHDCWSTLEVRQNKIPFLKRSAFKLYPICEKCQNSPSVREPCEKFISSNAISLASHHMVTTAQSPGEHSTKETETNKIQYSICIIFVIFSFPLVSPKN